MSSPLIRPVTEDDWAAVRDIRLESLADEPSAYGLTLEEARGWGEEKWRERVAARAVYVAEVDGRVVGTANGAPHDSQPGDYFLFGMYVTPEWRGRGVAEGLIDAASAWSWCQGARHIDLFVNSALPRAVGLYTKVGFTPTGEIHAMPERPGLEMVRMRRSLEGWEFSVRTVVAEELYPLRRRVLRFNDPTRVVADPRDSDADTRHYGGFIGPRLVVSASWYPSTSPVDPELPTWQLRYMATDLDVQGLGLGRTVIEVALDDLRALGVQQVWANGRDTALGFYDATGWKRVPGSEHLSPETQLPHTVIYRSL